IVGVDASRNRSGGAVVHLKNLLEQTDPARHGIEEIHVWSYGALLDKLPERPWLIKHNPKELENSLLEQIFWQYYRLPKASRALGCSVILNTDAGTLSPNFYRSITMSRDMLSYEPGEMKRYGFSKKRLRLEFLRYIQNRSFRSSDAVIFLTKHAGKMIQ